MLRGFKEALISFICTTPVIQAFELFNQEKLRILFYHRIAPAGSLECLYEPTMFVEENEFEQQMRLIREEYHPVCEDDVIAALQGNAPLPKKAVWVTFDDGYKDNFLLGYPLMKKYGIRATFFVTTNFIDQKDFPWEGYVLEAVQKTNVSSLVLDLDGRAMTFRFADRKQRRFIAYRIIKCLANRNIVTKEKVLALIKQLGVTFKTTDFAFMSWEDIRELAENGFFIGSHTVRHPVMSKLGCAEVAYEIEESKRRIEECTGRQVSSFAYPYGICPRPLSDAVFCNQGIAVAVTADTGPNDLARAQKFRLGRFDLGYRNTLDKLKFKLATCRFWAKLKTYTPGPEV